MTLGLPPVRRRLATALAAVGALLAAATVPVAAVATTVPVAPAAPITTTVPDAASTAAGDLLSWAPPALVAPTTIHVTTTRRDLSLEAGRDYVVVMPPEPLVAVGGLRLVGGRNVVLVGGEIHVPAGAAASNAGNRGLYLRDQSGTVHVEGLRITGAGLGEGINLDQRQGAVVQLQNVRVDTVHGSAAGHHADVIQTWAGPRQLRVDGLTGHTQYQGLFLLPQQFGTQPQPELMDLRRVDLHGEPSSTYLMWRDSLEWPMTLRDVWLSPRTPGLSPDLFLWPKGTGPGTQAWSSVAVGAPPGGEFVPPGAAGVGYVSPGYVGVGAPAPGGTTPARSAPYVALEPVRVLSTTATAEQVRCVTVAGGYGVPAEATSVVVNVTTVRPGGPGYAVVYPDSDGTGRTPPPTASTVNFEAGTDVANGTFVALPENGKVCYATRGAPTVGLIMDLAGYTLPGAGVVTQPAHRLLDTRTAGAEVRGPVAPRTVHTVQVSGRAGVPDDATAVLLNVTVTGATTGGNLRVYPADQPLPNSSVVNFAPGRDKANGTVVALPPSGRVAVWSDSPVGTGTSPVQVVLDVVGYVHGDTAYRGVSPTRVVDTRPGTAHVGPLSGALPARQVRTVPLAGVGPVPAGATAVVLNVTAIGPTRNGNLRVYPDSSGTGATAPPDASSINYITGRDVPNQVVVGLPPNGRVAFYSDQPAGSTVHLAVDVTGYLVAP